MNPPVLAWAILLGGLNPPGRTILAGKKVVLGLLKGLTVPGEKGRMCLFIGKCVKKKKNSMNFNTKHLMAEIGFSGESNDCSTTEEMEETQDQIEAYMKDEIALWLANHGSKLFSLECSKFLASENKKKYSKLNLKSK